MARRATIRRGLIWSRTLAQNHRQSAIKDFVRAVLIAAKELAFAKTRLGSLPQRERELLAQAMFRDVLAAAVSFKPVDCVAVVTSDDALLEQARRAGALVIDERYPRGLNAAVALATRELIAAGVTALCTLLSDTPLVTAADIGKVFDSARGERCVVLTPSRDARGTNIILRRPADAVPTRFGKRSLALHRLECERLEVPCQVLHLPGPAMDLDEVADLMDFISLANNTHTLAQLARFELALS
jgi:2-phospho-L-lactate/phosphoenolpyruvate guanylyltransferase